MQDLLAHLWGSTIPSGDVSSDAVALLRQHGRAATALHCAAVAAEAARIGERHGEDPEAAATAGWLHDISAVFPGPDRLRVAEELGLGILPEERAFPPILHQKLSVVLARELFGVSDATVLSAIGCHTTLRAGSTRLDQCVFLADKVAWDQPGAPPYLARLLNGLNGSLRAACAIYLDYLWEQRAALPVVHPWFVAAHKEMCKGTKTCP